MPTDSEICLLLLVIEKSAAHNSFPKPFGFLCDVKFWAILRDHSILQVESAGGWTAHYGDYNF